MNKFTVRQSAAASFDRHNLGRGICGAERWNGIYRTVYNLAVRNLIGAVVLLPVLRY